MPKETIERGAAEKVVPLSEVTQTLINATLAGKTPVLVTHVNHIGEVSEETEIRVKKLRKLGVQFFNQTVLLRKVNDDPDILAATDETITS